MKLNPFLTLLILTVTLLPACGGGGNDDDDDDAVPTVNDDDDVTSANDDDVTDDDDDTDCTPECEGSFVPEGCDCVCGLTACDVGVLDTDLCECVAGPADTTEDIVADITSQRCASCHNLPNPSASFNNTTVEGLEAAIGRPSIQVPELSVIEPGDSANSYIIVKLSASDPRRKGNRMPANGPPHLSQEEIDRIAAWIDAMEP